MTIQEAVRQALLTAIKKLFDIDIADLNAEVPPRTELGDLAFPVAFELAKRLKAATGQKQNPRDIANKLADSLQGTPDLAGVEVAGAGYLNLYLDRATFALKALAAPQSLAPQ